MPQYDGHRGRPRDLQGVERMRLDPFFYCPAFVAIRSMLFSGTEQPQPQMEIFTMICTLRCKSLLPLKSSWQ